MIRDEIKKAYNVVSALTVCSLYIPAVSLEKLMCSVMSLWMN